MPKKTSPVKNRGIAADKHARRRAEAEERNARTLPENRRQARLEAMKLAGKEIDWGKPVGKEVW